MKFMNMISKIDIKLNIINNEDLPDKCYCN